MHVQPFNGYTELIRLYPEGGCYNKRDKYCAVLTLEYNDSEDEVIIYGLMGTYGFRERTKLFDYIKSKGIKKVHREVKGKWISSVLS